MAARTLESGEEEKMSGIEQSPTHNIKVERIKKRLVALDLPTLPLNCVKSPFYVPDIITRVDKGFIVIDFINTKQRVPFDIGGLCLIYNKDIVESVIAIIDDALWKRHEKDFERVKMNIPPKMSVIPERDVEEWFKSRLHQSSLWKVGT
jgi:hypothetical protein